MGRGALMGEPQADVGCGAAMMDLALAALLGALLLIVWYAQTKRRVRD